MIYPKGTKLFCPKCGQHQATLLRDVETGEAFCPTQMEYRNPSRSDTPHRQPCFVCSHPWDPRYLYQRPPIGPDGFRLKVAGHPTNYKR